MPSLLPTVDPEGLLEYSVVYTDRAVNHMSRQFQGVMRDISATLKDVYGADAVAIVPGSGTFSMEAVARQFATAKKALVVRNGWFSYRWTQIFEAGGIPSAAIVMKARPVLNGPQAPWAPAPVQDVVDTILAERPDVVFAPHVETASGMMLPDAYIDTVSAAVRESGGLFVLDCIASGAMWVDMRARGVDVLISAPQKGWSASPCCGLVMMGDRALARLADSASTSFACDLHKWLEIMQAYEDGGHLYHATMPTDTLIRMRDVMAETAAYGFDKVEAEQAELGARVRSLLASRGFRSVAAHGFEAPSVVVVYTEDDDLKSGARFAAAGLQVAAGVPLQCDEPASYKTFRLGLFGLDKLHDVDRTVATLESALDAIL